MAMTIPATSPSTVLPGDSRGASGRRPNVRPPKYAPVSPMNVPTSTSITIPSPCGRSRSSTACANASPIHHRASSVRLIETVIPERCGCRSASAKVRGTTSTSISSTWNWPP